jgi:hypothetical protein
VTERAIITALKRRVKTLEQEVVPELCSEVDALRAALTRKSYELRLFHERELDGEECACESCAAIYKHEESVDLIEVKP